MLRDLILARRGYILLVLTVVVTIALVSILIWWIVEGGRGSYYEPEYVQRPEKFCTYDSEL